MNLRVNSRQQILRRSVLKTARRQEDHSRSLSTYFPKGTQFFYGYPSGGSSGFLNLVPPEVEELVAGRVACCAGNDVVPVCFWSTTAHAVPKEILDVFGIAYQATKPVVLPERIDTTLVGQVRDEAVKSALKRSVRAGSLVMAQPYLDDDLQYLYQNKPSVTAYFNDKHNMTEYIGAQWLPNRLGEFANGKAFAAACEGIKPPVVVKVSASSSGDGVAICKTGVDLKDAIKRFEGVDARVIVEEHISFTKSYGVHFGVPADRRRPVEVYGVNEQITTPAGEFLGGLIEQTDIPSELTGAVDHLERFILPRVRDTGWYGIGGFDVLIDAYGKAYFIDANFRMTGMSAYHFMIGSGAIKAPMASVMGEFEGTETEILDALGKVSGVLSGERFLKLICMSRHGSTWRFNGALEYANASDLCKKIDVLESNGINSTVLRAIKNTLLEQGQS